MITQNSIALGWLQSRPGSTSDTIGLNTSLRWYAYGFQAVDNRIASVILQVSGVVDQSNIAITAEIQALNSSYKPDGTAIASCTITAGNFPAAAAFVEFNSFGSHTLVVGTLYAIVLKNVSVDPTTSYPKFNRNYSSYNNSRQPFLYNSNVGWFYSLTTDGSTWASNEFNAGALMLKYASGLYDGITYTGAVAFTGTGKVYSGRESGWRFRNTYGLINVGGLQIIAYRVSTPATNLSAKIYVNGALKGVSINSFDNTGVGTSPSQLCFLFNPYIQVQPNDIITVTVTTSGGSSSLYYLASYTAWPAAAPKCFKDLQHVYYDGSAWSVLSSDVNAYPAFGLILDAVTPFPIPLINRRASIGR